MAAAAATRNGDRVGLGWRPDLAAGILSHLDRLDVIEIIAEDYLHAPRARIQSLRRLASAVPTLLHGVSLGLASSLRADDERIAAMARLVDRVQPEAWSEHLAFVRAGAIEIGHLAAPPRTAATIAGALANIARATRLVGGAPQLENIASLLEPPASTLDETGWISEIIHASGAPMLLDLHNLYANAVNAGANPAERLAQLPLDRVATVHLSGGHWIDEPGGFGRKRLLDDHVHDVPDEVFDLLVELAARADQPLTVIIERDGCYPAFPVLLQQLDRARAALSEGRQRRRREGIAA